jgi:hypothetical protein
LSLSGPANTTSAANKNFFSLGIETLTVSVGNAPPELNTL